MIIASDIPKHKPVIGGGKAMQAIEIREAGDPGT
jgi:hypothetical protein